MNVIYFPFSVRPEPVEGLFSFWQVRFDKLSANGIFFLKGGVRA